MKIAVFGITGGTGQFFLPEALARGHQLKVLVRNPAKLGALDQVEIIQGDANKAKDVETTLKGTQAVISLLGHTRNSAKNIQEVFLQQALEAMQAQQIRRIMVLTGSGIWFEGDQPTWLDRLTTTILKIVDPNRMIDGEKQARILQKSNTDWTIVRTPLQTNKPSQTKLIVGPVGTKGMGMSVGREDIVKFMLDILEDEQYYHQAPAISN